MVNSTEFAKRLQKILQYYGLSATAFSEEIDFNRSTISHLLSGRNRPSLEFVMKVLQKFPEVELYWLLNGSGTFPAVKEEPNPFSREELKSIGNVETSDNRSENLLKTSNLSKITKDIGDLEQVILFFRDGSFKVYKNHRK
jgi:transcriptional regulator with XRE-family HTH domain